MHEASWSFESFAGAVLCKSLELWISSRYSDLLKCAIVYGNAVCKAKMQFAWKPIFGVTSFVPNSVWSLLGIFSDRMRPIHDWSSSTGCFRCTGSVFGMTAMLTLKLLPVRWTKIWWHFSTSIIWIPSTSYWNVLQMCASLLTSSVHTDDDLSRRISNLVSSLHYYYFHSFSLQFCCNLANLSLFCLFPYLKNGFLTATIHWPWPTASGLCSPFLKDTTSTNSYHNFKDTLHIMPFFWKKKIQTHN